MLQKLLDETTKIYKRFEGVTEEPKEGLPGVMNIDIVAATMVGSVPVKTREPQQVCGPLLDETDTLRPVRVANMLVVGEESPLRVSHPGPINVATVDNVTSVTEVQGVLEVTSVANVVNVDTVLSVTEVSDVATVGVVTNVLSVADVGVVAEVTNVATVAEVANVASVAIVGEVTNVATVAEVANVATVAAVGAVATVASVEEVVSVTAVELVAAVTAVALVTEVAHVTGGNSVEVTNFPIIQSVEVMNGDSKPVPIKSTSDSPVNVTVDNFPAEQSVTVSNTPVPVTVSFPAQQHVLVDNFPASQDVNVTNTVTIEESHSGSLNVQPVMIVAPINDKAYVNAATDTRIQGRPVSQSGFRAQSDGTSLVSQYLSIVGSDLPSNSASVGIRTHNNN